MSIVFTNSYISFPTGLRPPTAPPYSPVINLNARDPLNTGTLPIDGFEFDTMEELANGYTLDYNTTFSVNKATLAYDSYNGFPAILVDNSFYDLPLGVANAIGNNFTMYVLFKCTPSATEAGFYWIPFPGANPGITAFAFLPDANKFYFNCGDYFSPGGRLTASPIIDQKTEFTVATYLTDSVTSTSGDMYIYQNNTQLGTSSGAREISIDGSTTLSVLGGQQLMCQLIVYSGTHDATQREAVYDYLINDWSA